MSRRGWQALRLLRVLLTCALLVFAARPSTPAQVWTEVPVLIARAVVTPPSRAVIRPSRLTRRSLVRPRTAPSLLPAAEPAEAAHHVVVVPDRYLRNCALLC